MDEKRFYRNLKRDIKKAGNKKRRNHLKRSLTDHPEEAHWDEYNIHSRDSSTWLNGFDEYDEYDEYSDSVHEGGCNLPAREGDQDHRPYRE